MTTIPDFTALMVAYQHGASNNRDRYERWFTKHPTKTMLKVITEDIAPSSTAVHSGFSAFNEGESSVFDFEDFLNQLMSAYIGKQKFLDEAKGTGTITEAQHRVATDLVTRHIAAIVTNGGEALRKNGANLSFTDANRLHVTIGQGEPVAPESLQAEEATNLVPVVAMGIDEDGVNIPNPIKIQALFPMLVEDVLLQFSRLFYSTGSSAETLEAIASYNSKAQSQADKMFEDMKAVRVTKTDLLELLTAKNIGYAAQRKFFKHLLIQKDISKPAFDVYVETVDATEQELMDGAFKHLATLNLRLSFDESARLVIESRE